MPPIVLCAWSSLHEWCDGGPTPDREEIREAFAVLVQGFTADAPPVPEGELAANVIRFCPAKESAQ